MYSLWDYGKDLKLQEETRKINLRIIGTKTDAFFIDKTREFGFEERTGQWEMSCEIVQAMIEKKHVLVEAGVGIGKTYAYIVPLLYYHKIFNKPIVIATSTIALQEQLENDLLTIEKIFDYYPDVLIAKGQNHFLCKNRLEEYFYCKRNMDEYKYYVEINKSGHQKSDWDIEIPDTIWNNINVSTFNPINCRQKCPHKDYCFYYQLRQDIKNTNGFILCNQDLLMMNMRKRHSFNNEIFTQYFEYIVVDEAHNLESRVRNSYTIQINYFECKKIIENIRRTNKSITNEFDKKIDFCESLLNKVFNALVVQIKQQDEEAAKKDKDIERYYVNVNIEGIDSLVKILKNICDFASLSFGMEDTYKTRGENESLEKVEGIYEFFSSMSKFESKDIFWMNSSKLNKESIIISKCPKNVNELTESLLFNSDDFRVIMTSATMSSDGDHDYNYFIANTNLPVNKTLICDSKKSPFDYDNHALIYYTEDMPHPSDNRSGFIEAGVDKIIKLINITQGKSLILFTAKRDMLEIYDRLHDKVPYKILIQNSAASQNEVIREFKTDENSVLLAVGSYWEGISIEGKSLSNLIIFRLPFPVPEPIINYKRSICKNGGLMEVSVPEMIIKLKQGIGRLIRNNSDYGIVAIIDSRLGKNSDVPYKQIVWDALPIKHRTNNLKEVELFFNNLTNIANK